MQVSVLELYYFPIIPHRFYAFATIISMVASSTTQSAITEHIAKPIRIAGVCCN